MKKLKRSLTALYSKLIEVLLITIERTWIPLSLGVNRLWLARIDVKSNDLVPSRVILMPYETPACRFQHKSLAAHIQRYAGAKSDVINSKFFKELDYENSYQDLKFDSFADLSHGIIGLCQGDLIFATGVIDSFIAKCSSDTFFGHFVIPKDFVKLIHATKIQARDLILDCSAIVLADGAGMHNRALISSALNLGGKAYIFNPDGDWLEFTEQHGENHRDFARYLKMLSPEEYKSTLAKANTFLDFRFKGKQKDLDSPGVFSEKTVPITDSAKKVLFMHVFRDANQVPLDQASTQQSLFSSYFEWADFCLREVAKKPEEWQVKLHPSSKFYGDEIEVQLLLLKKHGISLDLVDSCPTTHQILQNRWPIFTHSGTIALESAVYGYRSHVCSRRHPEQLVHLAGSKSQLVEQLRKPPSSIEGTLGAADNEMARLLLHWSFTHDLPLLAPKNPQPNRGSALKFQFTLMTQEISLMGRYLRPSTQVQLKKMAQEILSNRT